MTEIDNWGEPTDTAKQKDALIRELVAVLSWYVAFDRRDLRDSAKAALAKAKAQGFEP